MTRSSVVRALLVGFDSAWTDNPRNPGALAALAFENGRPVAFHPPRLARFEAARAFVAEHAAGSDLLLVAIDQPTVVPNRTGTRPVDRIAGSLIGRLKGGVQPACRDGFGARMFGDGAPIWQFLDGLGLTQDPERARVASAGRFAIEVFPALALPAFIPELFARRRGAKYNPAVGRHFLLSDWHLVCSGLAYIADGLGLAALADWARAQAMTGRPRKADQDRLDAALCLAIACHWRQAPADASLLLGDVATGYIVTPISPETGSILRAAGNRVGLPTSRPRADGQSETTRKARQDVSGGTIAGRVDPEALRVLLIGKAREYELIAYGEVAAHFGQRFHQGYMSSLKAALARISRQNRQKNEPQLMCLVVNKESRMPGGGYFALNGESALAPDGQRLAFDRMRLLCRDHFWT